jgi:hypothetical protein
MCRAPLSLEVSLEAVLGACCLLAVAAGSRPAAAAGSATAAAVRGLATLAAAKLVNLVAGLETDCSKQWGSVSRAQHSDL